MNSKVQIPKNNSKKAAIAILATLGCTSLLVAIVFAVLARRPAKSVKKDDDYFEM